MPRSAASNSGRDRFYFVDAYHWPLIDSATSGTIVWAIQGLCPTVP